MPPSRRFAPVPSLLLLAVLLLAAPLPGDYAWLATPGNGNTVEERIPPPAGFQRLAVPAGSFGAWLRRLPLYPGRPPVHLFDGRLKANQEAHHAVLALDVGTRDLQQCADAVIRLRAEFLRDRGCEGEVVFDFTSGDLAAWSDWRRGLRPRVTGRQVTWQPTAAPDASYPSFRRYLDTVFSYAGSASLVRELERVPYTMQIEPGDVFIQGGSPGHAVLVADVVENAKGRRAFLLLQSYMPAQEVHVLRNPADPASPWFMAQSGSFLQTPEWTFRFTDLKRFRPVPKPCRR